MTDFIKLSIIIPVYNAASSLCRCLDSILLHNAIANMEVICVNDGSTDNSGTILSEYSSKYDCIVIITQNNTGVSAARNAGLKIAKGEWIMFVDADDVLFPSALSPFLAQAECNNAELSIARSCRISRWGGESTGKLTNKIYKYIPDLLMALDDISKNSSWSKLFKKNIIQTYNLSFKIGLPLNEDACFVYTYLQYCNRVLTSDVVLYKYCVNDNNATEKYRGPAFWNYLKYYIETSKRLISKVCKNKEDTDILINRVLEEAAFQSLFEIYSIYRASNRPHRHKYQIFKSHLIECKKINGDDYLENYKTSIPRIFKILLKIHPYIAHLFLKEIFALQRIIHKDRN